MNMESLICDTLVDMMEEMPFDKIRVTQLVERSGISRSTFYVYYESVFEVLQYVEDRVIDTIIADRQVTTDISKDEMMDIFVNLRKSIRTFYILTGSNGSPSFYAKLASRNRNSLLLLAEKLGSKTTATELQIINEFTLAGKIKVFQWWAEHDNYISVNEMAIALEKMNKAVNNMLL